MLKKQKYWIIGVVLIIGLLGCSNSSSAIPKGIKALPAKTDKIIEDRFGQYRIYQRPDKSYYVYRNGRIVYDKLRFVSHATLSGKNNMQALDQHNKLLTFYLKEEVYHGLLLCGNGIAEHQIDISKSPEGFMLALTLTGGDVENFSAESKKILNRAQPITTVSNKHVDDLYFAKHAKRVKFENSIDEKKSILYYRIGRKYGVYGRLRANSRFKYRITRESQKRYDEIDFVGEDVYVRSGLLWGCIGKTAVKYRKLSPFVGRLARFELPGGRRGYVTDKGVEYVD